MYLVAIAGPTGTGKSRLAIQLASEFHGDIVNADSQQVYRHMDIGTAKPGREELAAVPHHLIDIIKPDESISVAQYQELAYRTINDIQRRGKVPFLVGGSGQYFWSVLEGWQIPHIPPDLEFRRSQEEKAATAGEVELYQELLRVDPAAAGKIDRRNVRRVIRALEVYHGAHVPFSQLQQKKAPPYRTLIIGLTALRVELYRIVDARVEEMMRRGLVAEVQNLIRMGFSLGLPAMSSIGYKQIGKHLKGEMTLAQAVEQMKSETHRLIRHQYMWFKLKDSRIHWFDIINNKEASSEISRLVGEFLTAGRETCPNKEQ